MYNWSLRRRRQGQNGTEAVFEELMAKNFPKLVRNINPQIQEPVQTPSMINIKKKNRVLNG